MGFKFSIYTFSFSSKFIRSKCEDFQNQISDKRKFRQVAVTPCNATIEHSEWEGFNVSPDTV